MHMAYIAMLKSLWTILFILSYLHNFMIIPAAVSTLLVGIAAYVWKWGILCKDVLTLHIGFFVLKICHKFVEP